MCKTPAPFVLIDFLGDSEKTYIIPDCIVTDVLPPFNVTFLESE